ncbi:MAG TPA: signal peptidase I, partial [Bacteroidetes bacterium]|nr:signal peptidase I [Bacteroidota bacterium]
MKKNIILGLIIILLLIPLSYFGYQVYLGELQFKTVLSGSMSPAMNAGDIVLISKINPEEIKNGDIITFREGKTFTTHRVVEIVNNSFRTKGDANEDPDMKVIKTEQVVGKVIFVIPFLGYLGHFVRTPLGFLMFILIPGILIIYSEIRKIRNEIKNPKSNTSKMKKGKIISKKDLSDKNHLRRNLSVYLIFVSFMAISFSPLYTGAFFSDTEFSISNILQAGTWGNEESDWDVSARFDKTHCNDFFPFSGTPGEIGKTYYAKLDGSSDDLYTEYHGRECCSSEVGGCGAHGYWGNLYKKEGAVRKGPWVVERKYVNDNTYRILIRGASKADCSCGGNGYVKGEVVINPNSGW